MYKTLCIHRKNGTIRHIGVHAENKRDLRKKAAAILEISCLGQKITTLDGEVLSEVIEDQDASGAG